MSVFTAYTGRRREISVKESVDTLEFVLKFFNDGENWRQHVYKGDDGGMCLVAAASHVQVSQIDDAKHWLRMAIKEKTGLNSIEQFNDSRSSFEEIRAIIDRAKELAKTGGAKAVALVGEVLPPERPALPAPAPVRELPVAKANRRTVATKPRPVRLPVARAPAAPRTVTPSGFFDFGNASALAFPADPWAVPVPAAAPAPVPQSSSWRAPPPRPRSQPVARRSLWDWAE